MRNLILLKYFLILIPFVGTAQYKNMSFKNISSANGLSQNHGYAVVQDFKGYMWFGTDEGLNKFDGYNMTVYKNKPQDSTTISSNNIRVLFEDSEKNLWIGTTNGLNIYNRRKNNFTQILNKPNDNRSSPSNIINAIMEDTKGRIWIATGEGLSEYNKNTHDFTRFVAKNLDTIPEVQSNIVYDVAEDLKGNLWISTTTFIGKINEKESTIKRFPLSMPVTMFTAKDGKIWAGTNTSGIHVFDPEKEVFVKNYRHEKGNPKSLSNDMIYRIYQDYKGNIWAGVEHEGLNLFVPKEESFINYRNDPGNRNSLSNNTVSAIYLDRSGTLWVGVHRGGFNYYNPNSDKFQHYNQNTSRNSVSHNNIKSFCEDRNGNVLIGTDGGGANLFDRNNRSFTYFKHNPDDPKSISGDVILCMILDSEGYNWFGTYGAGLNKYDHHTKTFIRYRANTKQGESPNSDFIWTMLEDRQGNLWLGTRGGGLNVWDRKTNKFTYYKQDYSNPGSVSNDYINILYEDTKGQIWVGGTSGLNLYEPSTKSFKKFVHDPKDPSSISNDAINAICEDHEGNLWVGTYKGLNLMNKKTGKFRIFLEKDGMPNDVVQGMKVDKEGYIWISTLMGISKFNPRTKTFKNFNVLDGLQANEYTIDAALVTKDGQMFFGGINGFNTFYPEKVKDNPYVPPVAITNFLIFTKPVEVGPNSFLKVPIDETESITMSYKESVFSLEFSALNYILPEKNQYAYKLEGFDEDWNFIGNNRTATYTNLDPGEYTFMVRGSNNDGVWNDQGKAIKIIITPPFWETWWFKALVAIIVVGGAISWYTIRMNAIKKQKEILEEQVLERTAEVMTQKEELEAQAENLRTVNEELASQAENLQMAYDEIKVQGSKLEELYTEMKDSIRAAEIIQQSLLPSDNFIKKYLPDSFILNRPKDVVSGDFYWFDVIDDKIIVATVDCTGHGVSGAFMSINGHHLLNQVIYSGKELDAADILNRLNEAIIKELNHDIDSKGEGTYEGMDVALCIIDNNKRKLQYAGANNPLYVLRNKEIIQIKGNKYSVGLSVTGSLNKFTNNEIELLEGDTLYLFSDGYADQLGGERSNQKFFYNRFRDLLKNIGVEEMEKQKVLLDKSLQEWRGEMEQMDDILVMGFKV